MNRVIIPFKKKNELDLKELKNVLTLIEFQPFFTKGLQCRLLIYTNKLETVKAGKILDLLLKYCKGKIFKKKEQINFIGIQILKDEKERVEIEFSKFLYNVKGAENV